MIRFIDFSKKLLALWVFILLLATLSACTPPIPRPNQITKPAIGTLMPGGHEESVTPNLGTDQSGALIVNQSGKRIQVAADDTIVEIPIGYNFLFLLPPGKHDFYIYGLGSEPHVQTETLEGGKLRYLYITNLAPRGG